MRYQIELVSIEHNVVLATVAVPAADDVSYEAALAYAERILTPTEGMRYRVVDLELGSAPQEMDCYACNSFNGQAVTQRVIALGRIVGKSYPIQTYELACGHLGS